MIHNSHIVFALYFFSLIQPNTVCAITVCRSTHNIKKCYIYLNEKPLFDMHISWNSPLSRYKLQTLIRNGVGLRMTNVVSELATSQLPRCLALHLGRYQCNSDPSTQLVINLNITCVSCFTISEWHYPTRLGLMRGDIMIEGKQVDVFHPPSYARFIYITETLV